MTRTLFLFLAMGCNPSDEASTDPISMPTDTSGSTTVTGTTAPVTTPPPMTLDSGSHIIEHDGLDRKFNLVLPSTLEPGAPLVVVMHGYGGSADYIQGYSGMSDVAEREGFAVVYPQGTRDQWNYNYWEVGYEFHPQSVDDLGFIRAVVDLVVADQGLNPDQVYATGMSNGGDMSYRLACEAADMF